MHLKAALWRAWLQGAGAVLPAIPCAGHWGDACAGYSSESCICAGSPRQLLVLVLIVQLCSVILHGGLQLLQELQLSSLCVPPAVAAGLLPAGASP
jgi:hypothetical protein